MEALINKKDIFCRSISVTDLLTVIFLVII